jgi:hypothetical protein
MRNLTIIFILLFFQINVFSQKAILQVYNANKEPIEGVLVLENNKIIGVTNNKGQLKNQFTLEEVICLSHVGFHDSCFTIDQNILKDGIAVVLREKITESKEVLISSKSRENNINSVQSGAFVLRNEDMKNIPRIGGETDPMKVLQLTPGVSKTDVNMGLNVRGGSSEQNLVIIDDAVIYNPTHLAGFLSIFNPLIINKITLIKSGIPSNYGGRLSSVIEVETPKNIPDKTNIKGNVGLLLSDLAIESPLFGKKASILVSARKSYIDEIVKPASKLLSKGSSFFNNSRYSFYDLNASVIVKLTDIDRVYFSSYFGNDDFSLVKSSFDLDNKIKWSNGAGSVKWLHHFNDKYVMKTTAYYSMNDLSVYMGQNDFFFNMYSKLSDLSLCNEHTYFINNNIIKAGVQFQNLSVSPNKSKAELNNFNANFGTPNEFNTFTISPYIHPELNLSKKIAFAAGIRGNLFYQIGPYDVFRRGQNHEITDTIHFTRNEKVVDYYKFEPRFSLRYNMDSLSSIKFSFTKNVQFLHQVNVTSVSFPTDFWMPASYNLLPQKGMQLSLGYFKTLSNEKLDFSAEVFYKNSKNLTEFNGGILSSVKKATMEENIITGNGKAYGVEFLLKKNSGKANGWITYTISRSTREFAEIDNGKPFPAKYDRTHDVSIVFQYYMSKKWKASMIFVYASGSAFTIPTGRYLINGNILNQYSDYNSYRMPDYHRMDLSFTYSLKKTMLIEQNLQISFYNVYSRKNPYYVYYNLSGDLDHYKLKVAPKIVSLFPFLPSINYEFIF